MTPLHACILLRDLKAFQRLLNVNNAQHGRSVHPGCASGSFPKYAVIEDDLPVGLKDAEDGVNGWGSPPKHRHGDDALGGPGFNVNEKDTLGRTALHIACSSPDCVEYARLLLKHPLINVNIPDAESHYTPLHRAMYVANIPAALLLLQRPDIDTTLKDNEGYTAFDLYNSTIEGTKPDPNDPDAELFMWGANLNATLGFSDGNNRSHPDQIVVQPKEHSPYRTWQDRLFPIRVRQVGMSKLHTVVVTSESGNNTGGGNLRVCGFGSGGRLGLSPHHHTQQYALSPLPSHAFSSSVQIARVAAGQDHTLALTNLGEVYSWGMNRFAQLGYVVRNPGDTTPGGRYDVRVGESGRWEGRTNGRAEGEGGKSFDPLDDIIQHTPRRVQDALRKEVVVGITASKMASACWTSAGDLFTWGTNSGQLGYERASQPQVLPRKVSKFAHKVIDVALSDTAMVCLLVTRDVICISNDKEIKINFPTQTLLRPKNQPYRPPPRKRDPGTAKLTTCDDVFAALSMNGEVFVFASPDSSGDLSNAGKTALIKPQKAWVLKKKYRAVKDVALGANGDIIVCTESGHVFVRTRNPIKAPSLASQAGDKFSGGSIPGSLSTSNLVGSFTGMSSAPSPQPSKIGSNFKFVRIPCLQRVTKVSANSSGAFGALKVDYRHAPIQIEGNGIAEDLKQIMPFVAMYGDVEWKRTMKGGRYGLGLKRGEERTTSEPSFPQSADPDDEDIDTDVDEVKEDILHLRHLCELVDQEKKGRRHYPKDRRLPFDADVMVFSQSEAAFPAHRIMLAARSHILCSVLEGEMVAKDDKANISIRFIPSKGKHTAAPRPLPSISTCGKLMISGCHTLTILVFLTYLYSDELLAVWDPRIKMPLQKECLQLKVKPDQVKVELQALARMLDLLLLSEALELSIKRVPMPSVARDIGKLWLGAEHCEDRESLSMRRSNSPLAPDVLLQLADREVWCHSLLLRTRLDLFSSFFGEEEWIVNRRDDGGVVKLNFRHLKWDVMQYVLRFVLCGEEEDLFERLDRVDSVDDVLEFIFSVMSAATELLLDRLVLICSSIILEHVNIQNACYVLNDATFFNANQLVQRLHMYMVVNLETLLEQRMLDDVPHRLVKQLAAFARQKQAEKSPVSRTTVSFDILREKYAEWLTGEDFPEPIIRPSQPQGRGVNIETKRSRLSLRGEPADAFSIAQRTMRRPPSGEDIFIMDEADVSPMVRDVASAPPSKGVWKPHSIPRVDMKSLMEAEAANLSTSPPNVGFKKPIQIRQTGSKDSTTSTPSPVSSLQRPSWRNPVNPPTTPKKPTPPSTPVTAFPQATHRKRESAPRDAGIKSPEPQLTPTSAHPQRPQMTPDTRSSGLGPVITPTRQLSRTSTPGDIPSIRRVSGKAWTLPAVEPVIATSPTSSSVVTSISFAAIQKLQLEQATPQGKDKRSLRDIQAEEEARQQEDDFLRWWTAEEERVRLESKAMSRALTESQMQASKSKRKGKGGKGNGRAKLDKPLQSAEEPGMEGKEQQRGSSERIRKSTRPKKNAVPNA